MADTRKPLVCQVSWKSFEPLSRFEYLYKNCSLKDEYYIINIRCAQNTQTQERIWPIFVNIYLVLQIFFLLPTSVVVWFIWLTMRHKNLLLRNIERKIHTKISLNLRVASILNWYVKFHAICIDLEDIWMEFKCL